MELHQILHMNAGEGETSYAKNSFHQKLVLLKVKPTLEKCIEELMNSFSSQPDCVKVADLGCCSGPNTYLTIQKIIESIDKACSQDTNQEPPTIQVFLNDLVANDFNTVFMSLPSFYEKLEKNNGRKYESCLIAAMPGSFYGRLFPEHSMHFFHSSYSLHWLSQVPKGLVTESGISLNKGCIYITKSSPPSVHEAYLDQFTHDFTMFLRMRSQEMVPQGQMIATFLCQSHDDDDDGLMTAEDLLDMAIKDLVIEGLVEEEKLDSFNLPNYMPSAEEVKKIIEEEGSFKILGLETFKLHHDESFPADKNRGVKFDEHVRAAYVATFVRAVFEPILGNHFGQAIIPDLFHRFTKNAAKVLPTGKAMLNNMILSLARK